MNNTFQIFLISLWFEILTSREHITLLVLLSPLICSGDQQCMPKKVPHGALTWAPIHFINCFSRGGNPMVLPQMITLSLDPHANHFPLSVHDWILFSLMYNIAIIQ